MGTKFKRIGGVGMLNSDLFVPQSIFLTLTAGRKPLHYQ